MQTAPKEINLMRNWYALVLLLITLLASTGCREKPQEPPLPESSSGKLFESQRAALEKAKAVEAELAKQAAKQAEAATQQQEQSSP